MVQNFEIVLNKLSRILPQEEIQQYNNNENGDDGSLYLQVQAVNNSNLIRIQTYDHLVKS
jgi:hypothetical protein